MNKLLGASLLALLAMSIPAMAQDSQDKKDELRLALAKVSLYAETNKLDQAFALIDQLKQDYPDNSQVLRAEADLNLKLGNRGAGFAALSKAVSLDPANEDILERQRSAVLVQGPYASAGYRYRHTTEANEHFAEFAGQATVSPSVGIGLSVQNDHLNTRHDIRRESGALQDFSGNRQRGTLTLAKVYDNGSEAGVMLHANNDGIGGGAQYTLWDRRGATTVQGNLRKPDWNYIEMVIEDGTRDNIRLERKQIITSHLQATLGGGYNRYNLGSDDNVADAAAWDLNIAYNLPYSPSGKNDDEIMFGVYYGVEAEYFGDVDERTAGGATFRPLPAQSYEIHSLNVSASKNLTSQLYGEAYGGYGIDRLGDSGPLFGAALEYSPVEHLGIELRGSRSMQGGISDSGREDQIGLNLKYRL